MNIDDLCVLIPSEHIYLKAKIIFASWIGACHLKDNFIENFACKTDYFMPLAFKDLIDIYKTKLLFLQLYEKQLKIHGMIPTVAATVSSSSVQNNNNTSTTATAAVALRKRLGGASLLDNCYSRTLIDTQNLKQPCVDIKEVIYIPTKKWQSRDKLFLLTFLQLISLHLPKMYDSKHLVFSLIFKSLQSFASLFI